MRRNVILALLLIGLHLAIVGPVTGQERQGSFKGGLVVSLLPDGRNVRLEQPFGYIDPDRRHWDVPKGEVTDGASIPRVFWLSHPPFTGKYRAAAVVHDYYCRRKTRAWRETHQMFYWAMRTGEVNDRTAKMMFGAVYAFGPRWGRNQGNSNSAKEKYQTPNQQKQFIQELESWISRTNPNIEAIIKVTDEGTIPEK